LSFLVLFKDTYRRERSLTYRSALQRLHTSRESVESTRKPTITGHKSKEDQTSVNDTEKQLNVPVDKSVEISTLGLDDVRLSIKDINPFPSYFRILSRKNNVLIFTVNGERTVGLLYTLLVTSFWDKDSSSGLHIAFHARVPVLWPTYMIIIH